MPFGNAVGEGFVNGVISKLTVAELGPGDGIFVYSGTPALGNLIASVTSDATNTMDGHGNAVLQGVASYIFGSGIWSGVTINGGSVGFYTASSEAGPYTFGGGLGLAVDGSGALFLDFPGGFEGTFNVPVTDPLANAVSAPGGSYSFIWASAITNVLNAIVNDMKTAGFVIV